MASETEYSNFATVAAWLAANMSPVFRANVITEQGITVAEPVDGSNALKFPKSGSVSAATVAESAAASKSELTDTSVSITIAKIMVYLDLTPEAENFGGGAAKPQRLLDEASAACAQKFDTDILALSAGFSQSSGVTTEALTVAKLDTAIYKVRLANAPGSLKGFLHPTQIRDVRQAIIAAAGTFWSGGNGQDVVKNAQRPGNGYAGLFLDVPIFESTNVPTANAGADRLGMIISPYAIACLKKPGFYPLSDVVVESGIKKLSITMWYNAAEYNDTAGCGVLSAV